MKRVFTTRITELLGIDHPVVCGGMTTVGRAELAAAVDLTPRTLSRRFKNAVGLSASAYLNHLRMKEARTLLKHSNLSIADIAWSTGINDASVFTQRFKNDVGMTPRQYRQAVRGKTFNVI